MNTRLLLNNMLGMASSLFKRNHKQILDINSMRMNSSHSLAAIAKFMTEGKGFDRVLEKVQVVSGGDGSCVAELEVGEEHLNRGGTLHGGFTATAVDVISTWALMTRGDGVPGVSVDLHMTYLKGVKPGDCVVFDASTIKAGRTLAFLKVDVKNKCTGEVIAKGSHTKFIGS